MGWTHVQIAGHPLPVLVLLHWQMVLLSRPSCPAYHPHPCDPGTHSPLQLSVEMRLYSGKEIKNSYFPYLPFQWPECRTNGWNSRNYLGLWDKRHILRMTESPSRRSACPSYFYEPASSTCSTSGERRNKNQLLTYCYFRFSDTHRPIQPNKFGRTLTCRVVASNRHFLCFSIWMQNIFIALVG